MNNIIHIKNLSLTLNGTSILHNMSLDIPEGEYLSIIGPNGAGKTTFLRCLLGMYSYEGTVQIHGKECSEIPPKTLAKTISYVPQTHDIEFPLSVSDFVIMGRYPYLSPLAPAQKKDIQAVECAMQTTAILPLRNRLLRTLSGGERQKVYIAAALAQETPVLFLDEPATFLDWKHQSEIMQLLKKINTECNVTVIAVNHDLNSAAHWSDQIIALKNGSILFRDTPEKTIRPDRLKELFETEFVRTQMLAPRSQIMDQTH